MSVMLNGDDTVHVVDKPGIAGAVIKTVMSIIIDSLAQ